MVGRLRSTSSAAPFAGATRLAFLGTVVFGGVHALASLYWGVGGRWLLDTVGQGAVELRDAAPWWIFAVLIAIGLAKVAGVAVPIANARGLLSRPRLWRALSWLGAIGLIAYGGAYTVIAHMALAGRFGQVQDREGLWGHAMLWSPLFFLWGVSLAVALALERRARRTSPRPV